MREPYQAPKPDLFRRYTFSCCKCGSVQSCSPSIAMMMGLNSGHAGCPDCKAFLHLEIWPDLRGCLVTSELHSAWCDRVIRNLRPDLRESASSAD